MANVVFTEPAERITEGILSAAERLGEYPTGHPLVDDELLRNVGLRMTHFDNYNIFYHYNEEDDAVYIIRVLYNKEKDKYINGWNNASKSQKVWGYNS